MMEGWKEVKIGDLGQVVTGNTPPKKDPANYGSEYPFIKPTDMEIDRRHVTNWEENYSEKAFKRYHRSYIPPKATGVVTIGTVGEKLFQADRWCFTNQSVNVVIPNEELYDQDFVYYLLKINLPKVENANPGTASGRHHVSKSNFCAIKVWVPESKDTQRKIASILSAYDDLIENNLKRINLLEEKVQLTYEEWFVRLKFPGHESTPIDPETGLPEEWEKNTLKNFSIKITKGTTPTSLGKKFVTKGIKFVKAESYTDKGFFIPEKFAHIDNETHEVLKRSKLLENDILVSIAGVLGRVAIVNKNILPANTNQAVGIVRIDESKISPLFIKYYLSSEYMKKLINIISGQAAQPNINLTQLGSLKVLTPDSSTMKKFHAFVEPQNKLQLKLQQQNQLLKEARDILLPRLMTGMIDIEGIEFGKGKQKMYSQ